ncbi:hypothetical protein N7447_009911 [Penicillium robsamsonii]|uniref:uncharacterized protein n=1 Tax=Penicillium robsamsonii TaxID=1792511 RepID=UPI002546E912|nr:uncharacterized protein N7447_009911 [Penicillium robsamsonii]KAJ5812888.1 hypothetical protein N7447_009911 [Penicillium robsamsonii]
MARDHGLNNVATRRLLRPKSQNSACTAVQKPFPKLEDTSKLATSLAAGTAKRVFGTSVPMAIYQMRNSLKRSIGGDWSGRVERQAK